MGYTDWPETIGAVVGSFYSVGSAENGEGVVSQRKVLCFY